MAVNFPDIDPDAAAEFWLRSNNTVFESSLSGTQQHRGLPGDRWEATLPFSNRQGQEARQLKSFIMSLGGARGRINITPPDNEQIGTQAGTGIVDGASQTGTTLDTSGWNASQPLLFDYGDYFSVNGELKMITAQISSDGSGNATLEFTPALRESPASGQSIVVSDPTCVMFLQNDEQARVSVSGNFIYNVTLSLIEDINA